MAVILTGYLVNTSLDLYRHINQLSNNYQIIASTGEYGSVCQMIIYPNARLMRTSSVYSNECRYTKVWDHLIRWYSSENLLVLHTYEGRSQISWTHLIIPCRIFVEVR